MIDSEKIYHDLAAGGDVDRRGWVSVKCPKCGAEGSSKNPHCQAGLWNERQIYIWHCFVCGESGTLADLVDYPGDYRIETKRHAHVNRKKPPRRQYRWKTLDYDREFTFLNGSIGYVKWLSYRPKFTIEAIDGYKLGYGVLPASRCRHNRLIVPVFDNGKLVGLRGRAIDCDCGKWLTSGGTKLSDLPLYNADNVSNTKNLFIVESPVDAIQITISGHAAVATYSTNYWQPRWDNAIDKINPYRVIVAFDNDLPGNGGGYRRDEFLQHWRNEHVGKKPPPSYGIKLVNHLLERGVNAVLFDWGFMDYKSDIGTLI